MNDIEQDILKYKKIITDYLENDTKFSYIGKRLKIIRNEIKKQNSVFELQHFHKILDISKPALINLESGTHGTDYNIIFKIIVIFSYKGYNPLWVITKENAFISKSIIQNESIFDVSTVQNATKTLLDNLERIAIEKQNAIDEFKTTLLE